MTFLLPAMIFSLLVPFPLAGIFFFVTPSEAAVYVREAAVSTGESLLEGSFYTLTSVGEAIGRLFADGIAFTVGQISGSVESPLTDNAGQPLELFVMFLALVAPALAASIITSVAYSKKASIGAAVSIVVLLLAAGVAENWKAVIASWFVLIPLLIAVGVSSKARVPAAAAFSLLMLSNWVFVLRNGLDTGETRPAVELLNESLDYAFPYHWSQLFVVVIALAPFAYVLTQHKKQLGR